MKKGDESETVCSIDELITVNVCPSYHADHTGQNEYNERKQLLCTSLSFIVMHYTFVIIMALLLLWFGPASWRLRKRLDLLFRLRVNLECILLKLVIYAVVGQNAHYTKKPCLLIGWRV